MVDSRFLLAILASVFCTCACTEMHLEYYETVVMACDDTRFNLTLASPPKDPAKKYWLLPDGSILENSVMADVSSSKGHKMINDTTFSLTVTRIDDADFGMYYCLLVWADHSVDVISYGLNVDGAYYGELLKQYRHNAMVGGIAAAILFGILCTGCVIWELRYHKRQRLHREVDDLDRAIDGFDLNNYDNMAMEPEKATNGPSPGPQVTPDETLDEKF